MENKSGYLWKLGLFVIIGSMLFIIAIYYLGKSKNLFGNTIQLQSEFKNVSGLKIGNNVRFSGINIGTVKAIDIVSDSAVMVRITIRQEVQPYIKKDARTSIGSDGLMGDKVLSIVPGKQSVNVIKNNDTLSSISGIELEDIMKSIRATAQNAELITDELAIFSAKLNNKNSILSKLINDKKLGKSLDKTMTNIEGASAGLNENMEAAKHNFLLRGYFNKKDRIEARKQRKIVRLQKKIAKTLNK